MGPTGHALPARRLLRLRAPAARPDRCATGKDSAFDHWIVHQFAASVLAAQFILDSPHETGKDEPATIALPSTSDRNIQRAIQVSNLPGLMRQLRSERGVTQDQLAEAIRVSKSLIAAFENHRLIPQPDTARHLDEFFGSGEQVRKAAAEAAEERQLEREQQPTWFKPWREIEELASTLRYFHNSLIPGVLQTEEYARSVLDTGLREPEEIERQLAIRMERQAKVLNRTDPPACAFILDHAALRCATTAMAKQQLTRLLEVGERPRTFIHLIPEQVGMHPGRSGAFNLATLDSGYAAGYMEDLFEGRVFTDSARVTRLDWTWQAVNAVALNVDQSRDLIVKAVNEL